ncbi:MAG: hypothetical protein ACR2RB_00730 [Gammaproteobacteria bacterium]
MKHGCPVCPTFAFLAIAALDEGLVSVGYGRYGNVSLAWHEDAAADVFAAPYIHEEGIRIKPDVLQNLLAPAFTPVRDDSTVVPGAISEEEALAVLDELRAHLPPELADRCKQAVFI